MSGDNSLTGVQLRFSRLLKKPGHRYIVIGGSVYIIELLVIVIAQHYFGASSVVAVGLSFWIGLMISFVLQKVFAFNDKRVQRRVLLPQIAAFTLLVLFNFGFTLLVTKLFTHHLPAVATRTIALGITTIWNFYLYKTRIFKVEDSILLD